MDVLSSAQLAEALCTRGLIEVQQYTWEHLAARLEQAYKNLLPKSQNHRGAMV